ncbi:hypothetical protein SDC9_158984 [bioreactor metagenome]|uniref:Uncharacterized protein n=2 Tax=root TaxID=1 RepID=A0A323UP91_9RHOO|nr:hypothetical protein [Parazoarcus communis SWub3 = DSM 12120]PZA14485.1 hypothetical protein DNK49_21655 [Azoarcus communis] [Parazoarcus communis SWub3 = DSM 12120]
MIQQNIFADGMTSIASDGEALKTTCVHVLKNDLFRTGLQQQGTGQVLQEQQVTRKDYDLSIMKE